MDRPSATLFRISRSRVVYPLGISINSRLLCCCFFSKWPTSSRFVELGEDDIYHFCEQLRIQNVNLLVVLLVYF